MVIWFDLSWSETWIIPKYKNLLNSYDKWMTRVQTNGVGDAICENVLQIVDTGVPKPRFWKGPDQRLFAGTYENDPPADEIWGNELLCWSQNCKNSTEGLRKWTCCNKSWSTSVPDTLWFVNMFAEMDHQTLQELNFGRQKSDSTLQGIRQMKKEQQSDLPGHHFLVWKSSFWKKQGF